MGKPLLSIIIPCAPNRSDRLRAVLSRLTLNKRIFPGYDIEVIVVDGGATDDTKDLCEQMAPYLNLKYVYVPICKFINAAYPRNIALRLCEGKVIGHLDIDHWISESIVYGMLNPFIDDAEFPVHQLGENGDTVWKIKQAAQEAPGLLNGQYIDGEHRVLNRGYVIDSSKSRLNLDPNSIPAQLLTDQAMSFQILDVYNQAQIPHGVNNTLWVWSAKKEDVVKLNGYDEIYARKFAYSREDDSWRQRLRAQITGKKDLGVNDGFFDGQNNNFCGIHLYHPASWRGQDENNLNKDYFNRSTGPKFTIERNDGWPWGKLLDYSFSIINGKVRGPKEHEEYIAENIPDMPSYTERPSWPDIDKFMEKLEDRWKNVVEPRL